MEELAQRHRIQSRRSKERRAIVLSRIDRLNGLAAKVIGREIAKPVRGLEIWDKVKGRRGPINFDQVDREFFFAYDGGKITMEQGERISELVDRPKEEVDQELDDVVVVEQAPARRLGVMHVRDEDDGDSDGDVIMLREFQGPAFCAICMVDDVNLHQVSYYCNHKFCKDCILHSIKSSLTEVVKCPGCTAHGIPESFVGDMVQFKSICDLVDDANTNGLMDPGLVNKTFGRAVFSRAKQLKPFIPDSAYNGEPMECPACGTLTCSVLSVTAKEMVPYRCANPSCALVFCSDCLSELHIGKCSVSAPAPMPGVENCPRCKKAVTHIRDHGCHHVTCSCGHAFCWLCKKPGVDRCTCPVFCNSECDCQTCDTCRPGKPCPSCTNGCGMCQS